MSVHCLPTRIRSVVEEVTGKIEAAGEVVADDPYYFLTIPAFRKYHIDCSHAVSERNFAAVAVSSHPFRGFDMYFCEDLEDQPITRIRGIVWHEFGHVVFDSAHHVWSGDTRIKNLDEEQVTDFVIFDAFGVRIYYDNEYVQRAGPGARGTWPRPYGLR